LIIADVAARDPRRRRSVAGPGGSRSPRWPRSRGPRLPLPAALPSGSPAAAVPVTMPLRIPAPD